jgi:16S rRNA (guanine966-N2)-methyltransferase
LNRHHHGVTRVVAGAAKGRHLEVPDTGTRPTSDRIREALFSALEHRLGSFEDLQVLDLYAGSAALGLEARSRGASFVLLMEKDRRAAEVIRRNIDKVGLGGVQLVVDDVRRAVNAAPLRGTFDLVFIDPPYSSDDSEVEQVLTALAQQGWLNDGAAVVVERGARGSGFVWPDGYTPESDRRYGGTAIRHALWYRHSRDQGGMSRLV